jgi:aminoglycoside phosphotransferase (APT) family kinase protein
MTTPNADLFGIPRPVVQGGAHSVGPAPTAAAESNTGSRGGLHSERSFPAAEAALYSRLTALSSRIEDGASGVDGLQRLSGGATQEIWRFELQTPRGPKPLILRRAPGGDRVSESAVGLEVEARLIALAGAQGVPVPPVVHVLTPEDGLGRGFIMGFVEGETLGGRIVKAEALASVRQGLARQCGEILARIHSVDPVQTPTLPVLTPRQLVEQWRSTYRASGQARPVFEVAFRWLAEHCPPPPDTPCLVHGDFRNGNLIVGPEGVRAVLDWELAHIGDPMEDFGWICINSWRFGQMDKPVGGFGVFDDLVAGYEAAGGGAVDRNVAKWWEVFGTLRWGCMCARMANSFRTVESTIERAMIARRTSETEIDLLRLFGIAHAG